MSTTKRAADPRRMGDVGALLDRRHFVLDPERWAAFQAALDASARPNPSDRRRLEGVSQFLSQFSFRADPLARKALILKIRRDVRVVVRLCGFHLRASRYGGQVAASAGHLAVARAGLKRERRRMKEHAWKAKRASDM